MRFHHLGPLRSIRRYSQAADTGAKRWEYFSLVVKGNHGRQATAIDKLREYVNTQQKAGQWTADSEALSSSLVLLASRDVASWLGDKQFMSDFLKSLQISKKVKGTATIDVLSGVTEGLNPHRLLGQPRSGISVLYGTKNMLPRLWGETDTEAGSDLDRAASISLSTAIAGEPFNSNITIPLANTIFQNGRRSTLFATRYETDSTGRIEPVMTQEKSHQDIEFVTETGPIFKSQLPLIPLTPPRKIVAGLGNIVRQVEINGVASPASKELELLIPPLLERRKSQSAVGVWAMVIPPHVMEAGVFADLQPFNKHMHDKKMTDFELVKQNNPIFWGFNRHGFRIHKILSGGGGWGAKAGLLSLDPDTSYTRPDQENIDDFIKAFEARNSQDSSQGIVAPGSYILFCAQPELPRSARQGAPTNRGWYFGVSEKREYDAPQKSSDEAVENDAWVVPRLFSAMSSEGLYLKLDSPGHQGMKEYPFMTKIDVPHAYLRHAGF